MSKKRSEKVGVPWRLKKCLQMQPRKTGSLVRAPQWLRTPECETCTISNILFVVYDISRHFGLSSGIQAGQT